MRAEGVAGGAHGWLPVDWAAGESPSPSNTAKPGQWRRILFGEHPVKTLRRVLVWSTTTLLVFHHLLIPIKVTGASMTPTYRDGSVNFINRLSYAAKPPKRGDVVILRDGEDLILKRVIALPGERVELDRGQFRINGQPLRDRFSMQPVNWDFDPLLLGPNEYFVIGDNRTYSIFGKFSRDQILGKIFF
jgi:signal peptidase I